MTKASPAPAAAAADLLLAVGRRDRLAFAALFRIYAPQLKRYFLHGGTDAAAADELVQECMLAIWRRADTYDPSRSAPATWIYTIARNKRIDAVRRERRPEIDERDPALVPAPARAPEAEVHAGRARQALITAIADLPPDQASVLNGAYFEDKGLPEIAAATGVPLGTIKSRVRLALERLRAALGEP